MSVTAEHIGTVRRPAVGLKLAALAVATTALLWVDLPLVSVAAGLAAVVLARVGGAQVRKIVRFAVPVVWTVAAVAVIHLVLGQPGQAARVGSRLLAAGLLAVAFTLTTRSTDIVAWVERVLTTLRVRPSAVFRVGLVSGLTTRSFEHLGVVARRVLDARRSRGLQRSARAFAVPLVVEAARLAHGMGEALDARGIGDTVHLDDRGDPEPYRFIRAVIPTTADAGWAAWTPGGGELGPAATLPASAPAHLVAEAMAQTAGMLMAATAGPDDRRWLLGAIDAMDVVPVRWGVPVRIDCTVVRRGTRGAHVVARALQGDLVCGNAALLMVPFTPTGGGAS